MILFVNFQNSMVYCQQLNDRLRQKRIDRASKPAYRWRDRANLVLMGQPNLRQHGQLALKAPYWRSQQAQPTKQ